MILFITVQVNIQNDLVNSKKLNKKKEPQII